MDVDAYENSVPEREQEKPPATENAQKVFSRMGFLLLIYVFVSTLAAVFFEIVYSIRVMVNPVEGSSKLLAWLIMLLPQYVIAYPLAFRMMKKLPATEGKPEVLGKKRFWQLFLIANFFMFVGNSIGTTLAALLTLGMAENPVVNYVREAEAITVLQTVVLTPLFEEYLFRKRMLDRCRRYGEKTALLFSALMFGLFHLNIYQFFYAFGVGLIFGYVYLRTNRLWYCIVMHGLFNFMGSVLATWWAELVSIEELEHLLASGGTAVEPELLLRLLLYVGYLVLQLAILLAGLMFFINRRKKAVFLPAEEELPKEERFKVVYLNKGVISFVLLSLVCGAAVLFAVML